jgi:hypothetical protein
MQEHGPPGGESLKIETMKYGYHVARDSDLRRTALTKPSNN